MVGTGPLEALRDRRHAILAELNETLRAGREQLNRCIGGEATNMHGRKLRTVAK